MQDMSANPFWDYSLAHYAQPGVAQCCLDYQDQHKANINLLLFCCWLGSGGIHIEPEELEQAKLHISPWDGQVVQPIRKVRRFIATSSWLQNASFPSELIGSLQQVELMAEQVVQNDLFDWYSRKEFTKNNKLGLQAQNLNAYFLLLGCGSVSDNSPLLCSARDSD